MLSHILDDDYAPHLATECGGNIRFIQKLVEKFYTSFKFKHERGSLEAGDK